MLRFMFLFVCVRNKNQYLPRFSFWTRDLIIKPCIFRKKREEEVRVTKDIDALASGNCLDLGGSTIAETEAAAAEASYHTVLESILQKEYAIAGGFFGVKIQTSKAHYCMADLLQSGSKKYSLVEEGNQQQRASGARFVRTWQQ
eukprot:scaffold2353_cov167-Amphora_coffeaeformis.AAC.53